MKLVLATLKKVLFWSYERATWQYDIMVVLILAFIFFAPNKIFHSQREGSTYQQHGSPVYVTRDEVGEVQADRLQQRISELLSTRAGRKVEVIRVEDVVDNSKQPTGYLVWEK
ncbi:MAG TPA: hypothetical protein VNN73_16975 [Blastocatellia bacterium]|nr:hypothetical protein [Blastocatellia bacterium]